MIEYREIMDLGDGNMSLRVISASIGHSRPNVTKILLLAKDKGLYC